LLDLTGDKDRQTHDKEYFTYKSYCSYISELVQAVMWKNESSTALLVLMIIVDKFMELKMVLSIR
jgi:hypothetical protein